MTTAAPYTAFPNRFRQDLIARKRLLGCWYGSANVHVEIPRLLSLYRRGRLKLDELITRTYPLSAVNQAFSDMTSGANARGVIVF